MKNISFLITMFITLFTGCGMSSQNEYLSEEEKLVNNILNTTASKLEKKYQLKASGEGAAMPGGVINTLTLAFDIKGPLSKDILRKILIAGGQELINQVECSKNIQKYLKDHPFSIKEVDIILYNHDKNGRTVYDPEIAVARISDGILIYRVVDASNTVKYKQTFTETYEEAIKQLIEKK